MSDLLTHTDFTHKYRIKYPAAWTCNAISPTCTGFFSPRESPADPVAENVNVLVEEMPKSLEQWVEMQLAQMHAVPGFQVGGVADCMVANLPARQISFSGPFGPFMANGTLTTIPLQWLSTCVIKDGRGYSITYTAEPRAYDKFMPQVQAMLDSLELS